MGVAVRGVDDTGVVVVGAVVEPDTLRDDTGGGTSTGGGEIGLGGGDGERVGCTGGGSISEAGISETSPGLPSISGDSAGGGDDGSIETLFRRGELVRDGEALRSGESERKAFVGTDDV